MSQENLDRYRRLAEAFARRDLDACLELLDPNVDWAPRSAELEGSSYTGHEGFRSWWETMFRLFSEYRNIEIAEARDLGDVTLGRVRVRGHGLGSGAPMEETHWHVVEWRDGAVVRWRTLRSEAEARQAAGLPAK
jgi:ketosteroid isomerase-like protein